MRLADLMWEGEEVFVVGGGASLRGFDFSRLKRAKTIAVNRAYERLPSAVLCSMDLAFWKTHGKNADALCAGPRVHVRVGAEKLPAFGPTHVVPCCADLRLPNPHLKPDWGTSLGSGLGCGGNSGFAAINLAHVLGARRIYLLGFDGTPGHWHDGYDQPPQGAVAYARMDASLRAIPTRVARTIANLNLNSEHKMFEHLDVGEVLT